MTSFDVIRRLRKALGVRKMGHSGVLDKPATGVLPIGIGGATRLFYFFQDYVKVYLTTFILGFTTDTDDIAGKIIEVGNTKGLTERRVKGVIERFIGDIDQIPPRFSTTKVDGKRFYKLASRGEEVPQKIKRVAVDKIDLMEFKNGPSVGLLGKRIEGLMGKDSPARTYADDLDGMSTKLVTLRIFCRGGFYVRSLARDIGKVTGAGGCVFSIVREQVGPFRIEDARSLEDIEAKINEDRLDSVLLSPSVIADPGRSVTLDLASVEALSAGRPLQVDARMTRSGLTRSGELVYVLDRFGNLVAVASVRKAVGDRIILQPRRVFGGD